MYGGLKYKYIIIGKKRGSKLMLITLKKKLIKIF